MGAGLSAGAASGTGPPSRRGLRAHAAVATVRGPGGETRLHRLRSAAPLSLRETPDGVYLVGTAAGPLGGDRVRLDLDVAAGTILRVRSAAGTLALPGGDEAESVLEVTARIEAGGCLSFHPEPLILAAGCRHRVVTRIELAPGASLSWWEEVRLGRHGEAPGRFHGRIEADVGAVPLLRQDLLVGDETGASLAVYGDARCVGSLLLAGPAYVERGPLTPVVGDGWAVLPLSVGGALVSALAPDAVTLRRRLTEGERVLIGGRR